jgi:hypothetical protein
MEALLKGAAPRPLTDDDDCVFILAPFWRQRESYVCCKRNLCVLQCDYAPLRVLKGLGGCSGGDEEIAIEFVVIVPCSGPLLCMRSSSGSPPSPRFLSLLSALPRYPVPNKT